MSDDSGFFLGRIDEYVQLSSRFAKGVYKFILSRVASGATSPVPDEPAAHDESDEEEFVYPDTNISEDSPASSRPDTHFVATSPIPAKHSPSPAQLESLHAAAASGDLKRVQTVFHDAVQSGDVEPFALANDAPSRIGQTALHAASSRGYLGIVKWCMYSSMSMGPF